MYLRVPLSREGCFSSENGSEDSLMMVMCFGGDMTVVEFGGRFLSRRKNKPQLKGGVRDEQENSFN